MAKGELFDLGSLIHSIPGRAGGRPLVAGTGVTVHAMASLFSRGATAEELAEDYDLPLSHAYAAIAYYLANKSEIDTEIKEDERLYDRMEAEDRASKSHPATG